MFFAPIDDAAPVASALQHRTASCCCSGRVRCGSDITKPLHRHPIWMRVEQRALHRAGELLGAASCCKPLTIPAGGIHTTSWAKCTCIVITTLIQLLRLLEQETEHISRWRYCVLSLSLRYLYSSWPSPAHQHKTRVGNANPVHVANLTPRDCRCVVTVPWGRAAVE